MSAAESDDTVTVTLPLTIACEVEERLQAVIDVSSPHLTGEYGVAANRVREALRLLREAMLPPGPPPNVVPLFHRRRRRR